MVKKTKAREKNMSYNQDIVERCLTKISKLPQAPLIRRKTAVWWIERTLEIDAPRIDWHITRAGGVGGSEIHTTMCWEDEEYSFETAHRLAKRKLLQLPPDLPNEHTGRGIFMEDYIKDMYEKQLTKQGFEWKERLDIKHKIEASTHPKYPWLRASLDGLYEINGKLVIVDFKAPTEEAMTAYIKHEHFDNYRAQLNHYDLVAEGLGIEIDSLTLCMFDYRNIGTGLPCFSIKKDPELRASIISSSSDFWNNYVLQGRLPELKTKIVVKADNIPERIQEISQKGVLVKMAIDCFSDEWEDIRKEVADYVKTVGLLQDGILKLGSFVEGQDGFLEVKAKTEFDIEQAVIRLQQLGLTEDQIQELRDPNFYDQKKLNEVFPVLVETLSNIIDSIEKNEAIEKTVLKDAKKILKKAPKAELGDFNEERIKNSLANLGEMLYTFEVEKISSGLPRGKKQDVLERRALVAYELSNLLKRLVPCKEGEDNQEISDSEDDIFKM